MAIGNYGFLIIIIIFLSFKVTNTLKQELLDRGLISPPRWNVFGLQLIDFC